MLLTHVCTPTLRFRLGQNPNFDEVVFLLLFLSYVAVLFPFVMVDAQARKAEDAMKKIIDEIDQQHLRKIQVNSSRFRLRQQHIQILRLPWMAAPKFGLNMKVIFVPLV